MALQGVDTSSNGGTTAFSTSTETAGISVTAVNDAPVFTNLGGAHPAFTENGSSVVLDNDVTIADVELDALGNYGGATLSLVRHGGANADDAFAGVGSLDLTDVNGNGENVSLDHGVTFIGTATNPGNGTFSITFNSSATASNIDAVMHAIVYSNTSDNPPAAVQVDWSFNDGNTGRRATGGAGIATGSVTVDVTQVNDRPFLFNVATGAGYVSGTSGVALSPSLQAGDLDATRALAQCRLEERDGRDQRGLSVGRPAVRQPGDLRRHFVIEQDNGDGTFTPIVTNISVGSNSFGRLVLTGTDTPQDYQGVLDAVDYRSTAADPTDNGGDATRTITWQVNDGAPVVGPLLHTAPTAATGASPDAVAAADLNGDGILDLVAANGAANTVSVLLGKGDGTFLAHLDFAAGSEPRDVAIGDLNGDGNLDLAVADFGAGGGISVLLGDGTGHFGAPLPVAGASLAVSLQIADLNGDGKADLIAANANDSTISVLLGDGTGHFGAPHNFNVGGGT